MVTKKNHDCWFLNGTMYNVIVDGAVWCRPLIFQPVNCLE